MITIQITFTHFGDNNNGKFSSNKYIQKFPK